MCKLNSPVDLSVTLGRLRLPNPILVASGTFGYAREMQGLVDLGRLGGILPKTITKEPRAGNAPWRTIETPAGMLNSIGLDNDGIESFIEKLMPFLASLGVPIVVSVAGRTADEFVELTERLADVEGVAAVELNISCPNVSGGVDFGTDPAMCEDLVRRCRQATDTPIVAKLTPNVTSVASMAKAASAGGADALSLVNTCLGMAVDWRNKRPLLGNVVGWTERTSDQTDRAPLCLPSPPGDRHANCRHWRNRDHQRRHGVPRRRRDGGSTRHGELLQSEGVHGSARRTTRGAWRTQRNVGWQTLSAH